MNGELEVMNGAFFWMNEIILFSVHFAYCMYE